MVKTNSLLYKTFLVLELSKNEDIIITCPDKGSGIVILNKADYIKKMEEIVADTTKFKVCKVQDLYQISRKIERKVRTTLLNLLKKPGHLTDDEYKRLYPNGSHIGVLYGLPKVHKPNVPTRPICSMVGTSTYELGKYIADIIKPAATSSLGTDLTNTFQFVEQIGRKDLSDVHMISFDVKSLFTNIPLNKTINICLDRLYRRDPGIRPSIPEDTLKKLLELCVCDNTFVFNGKVYQQVDGVAMGSSLGPLLANIYMAHLEEEFYFNESRDFSPTFYRRYVDDTFCLFKKLEHADQFMSFINTVDPSIQFDMELEVNSQLPFLDTVVKRNNNNVFPDISTHVKPTDKGLFYNFNSFIPDRYKYNLMSCLIHRVYHIASSFTIFHEDLDVLRTKFLKNGFPLGWFDNTVGKFLNKQYLPEEKRYTVPKRAVTMVLPYLGPLSIVIRRRLRRLIVKYYPLTEFNIVFKRGRTIRSMFSYKDKFPLRCRSRVVYHIQCEACGPRAAYVGKTVNTLYERFYGSNGHLHPSTKSSALLEHLSQDIDPKCEFNPENIKVLDTCSGDLQLRYAESIHLKHSKQTLNTQERSIPLHIV